MYQTCFFNVFFSLTITSEFVACLIFHQRPSLCSRPIAATNSLPSAENCRLFTVPVWNTNKRIVFHRNFYVNTRYHYTSVQGIRKAANSLWNTSQWRSGSTILDSGGIIASAHCRRWKYANIQTLVGYESSRQPIGAERRGATRLKTIKP